MKKILISLFTIGVVAAVAVGATRAYFTDQETVSNTLSSGRVNVDLRGPYSGGIIVPLGDSQNFSGGLAPGVESGPYEIQIYNKGWGQSTLAVKYRWTSLFTDGNADLYNLLNVRVIRGNCDWIDTNPGGLDEYYNGRLSDLEAIDLNPLHPNITRCAWFWFELDETADNALQGQIIDFDLILDATQTNNPGWDE